MEKIIEIKNLSFWYDQEAILRDINLTIHRGDFVAIMGGNGTGKSTLLKLLMGIIQPTQGQIMILQQPITKFKGWPQIGYVPQTGIGRESHFPATCEEIVCANLFSQIGFLRLPQKKHLEKTREALKQVGMENYGNRLISHLSGGQQQRVMLAQILVNEPEVVILDEPTTGIDAQAVEGLYHLLKKLNREKSLTIVMVTHDTDKICSYINKKYCLQDKGVMEVI